MKNLKQLITIIALAVFMMGVNNGFCQNSLNDTEVKNGLITGFANFVESVRPFYYSGDSYSIFKRKVLIGTTDTKPQLPILPKEGEDMLKKAYEYLSQNITYNQIIKKGEYKTMGRAVVFVNNYMKSNRSNQNSAELALFGTNIEMNNQYAQHKKKCKWWQLWCHLNEIFGDLGPTVLQIIVEIIVNLL